jgi:hypothetical protein
MSEQPTPLNPKRKPRGRSRATTIGVLAITIVILIFGINGLARAFRSDDEPAVVNTSTAEPTVEASPEVTETPTPSATPTTVEVYDDCAAVWAALHRPIFKEDTGYRAFFDWDANGIGCEDNPLTPEDEATIDWPAVRERFSENLDDIGDYVGPKLKDFHKEAQDFFAN